MRRGRLIAGFAAAALVLLGALGWMVWQGLRLEAAEAEASRRAALEERVRLALWRMDSALAAFVAYENAVPADPPAGPRPPDPPHLRLRFELAAGVPAVVRGPVGAATEPAPLAAEALPAAARDPDRLAALLAQPPLAPPALAEPPEVRVAAAGPTGRSGRAPRAGEPAQPAAGERPAEPRVAAAATSTPDPEAKVKISAPGTLAKDAGPAATTSGDSPRVAQEEYTQNQLNIAEFTQRARVAEQQQAGYVTQGPAGYSIAGPEIREAGQAAAPARDQAAGQSGAEDRARRGPAGAPGGRPEAGTPTTSTTTSSDRHSALPSSSHPASSFSSASSSASLDRRPPRPATAPAAGPATGPSRVETALQPVWDGDDLLLVRRVVRDGGEALQGMVLDPVALRGWLLAEVADLLPAAALEPVRPGEPADPGRRLALLPLRLEPGPPPAVERGGLSPARLGLGTAASAVALTVLAAALLLGAGLRLARRQTEFASAVIHELRSPLTSFRLYTDMLAEDMVPPAERPRYLETLRGEAERLGRLVENVLAYSRLERRSAGAAGRAVEEVELAPLLRRAAGRLAHREAGDGLDLRLEVAPEVEGVRVRVDPLAVERILENLCDNSCRHGRLPGAPAGVTVELAAALHGRHAVVRWSDHGPGVPRAARRRLFRPFHRAPAAAGTGAGSGIGLGLALSRRLARGFGGDLRHLDPPGGGAAFELWLPGAGAVSPR